MIFGLCMLFLILGTLLSVFDMFIPAYPVQFIPVILLMRIMGLMLLFLGIIILGARIIQTDVGMWLELPSTKYVNLIHSHIRGRDPDAKFIRAKRLDLETLKAKNKLFKDAGGSFRIGGHSCRRTYETIGFTVPDWLSNYFHQIKEKFGLRNSDEFKELRRALKNLKDPTVEGNPSLESQLKQITLLKPIMDDENKKRELLSMGYKKLKDLEFCFYDGVTHNGDDVELFIDSATPNELDILEGQTFLNEMDRAKRYRDTGSVDWGMWIPWLIVIMFASVIVIMILKSM